MAKNDFSSTNMTDVVLHVKTESPDNLGGRPNYVFPVTRYENVMGRPQIVNDLDNVNGSPFVLYTEGEVSISDAEYELLFSHIQ